MHVDLPAGKYVVAVSGGVDSVVLLHLLTSSHARAVISTEVEKSSKKDREDLSIPLRSSRDDKGWELVVAHYDHGIREDSAEDRELVQGLAEEYRLPFEYAEGKLGPDASEAVAREARYAFLRQVREKYQADGIVTAHHQDDVLETAILNLLRGTGRRGLASLRSTSEIRRPLLDVPKKELLRYAKREGLQWREDSTNADPKYLRNYVRLNLLPRFAKADREALLGLVRRMAQVNNELDTELEGYVGAQPAAGTLGRHAFISLRHAEAREVMAFWLRKQTGTELSRQLLERLVIVAKTGRNGSKVDVDGNYWLLIKKESLQLQPKENSKS